MSADSHEVSEGSPGALTDQDDLVDATTPGALPSSANKEALAALPQKVPPIAAAAVASVTATLIILLATNAVSAIAIVAVNKSIYHRGFRLPSMLMAFHFVCTWAFALFAQRLGWFAEKRIPSRYYVSVGLSQAVSVACVNLSLVYNSMGMYQLMKFLTILVMCVFEYWIRGKLYSMATYGSLLLLVIGIVMATAGDVQTNALGLFYGLVGALTTAHYQVVGKRVQQEQRVEPMQLLQFVQLPSAAAMLCIGLVTDDVFNFSWQRVAMGTDATVLGGLIALSGGLAFVINVTVYSLIGATSPLTYGVLGHVKTMGIFAFGLLVMREPTTWLQLVGFAVATAAMVAYLKVTSNG